MHKILSLQLLENVVWQAKPNINLMMREFDSIDNSFFLEAGRNWSNHASIRVVLVGYRLEKSLPTIEDAQYEVISLLPKYRLLEGYELAATFCHLEEARRANRNDPEAVTWREVSLISRRHMLCKSLSHVPAWYDDCDEKPSVYDIADMRRFHQVKRYHRFALTPYLPPPSRLVRQETSSGLSRRH